MKKLSDTSVGALASVLIIVSAMLATVILALAAPEPEPKTLWRTQCEKAFAIDPSVYEDRNDYCIEMTSYPLWTRHVVCLAEAQGGEELAKCKEKLQEDGG